MLYRGVFVDEINLLVFLKEESSKSCMKNERKVLQWLKDNNIRARVENPIDDAVYIWLPYDENNFDNKTYINSLTEAYQKAESHFKEVKISLHLSKFLDGYNEYDFTIQEFLELI
ncbi:hypothetical protein [Desulfitobacterium hafniense]|uniref:hypothetical protein n=1 Tax=Desulfitobacterium hafniense TaxID=49338 RepID=UPI0003653278|nr:hypothetical protein [Desulfitobacterium hafniense]